MYSYAALICLSTIFLNQKDIHFMNSHNLKLRLSSSFTRAFVTVMFLCFCFCFCSVAFGQYNLTALAVDPYVDNRCVASYSYPMFHAIYDPIRANGDPQQVLATFTGGLKVGSYSLPCMGMVGYATSRRASQ
jgi:hypothetical protein